MSSHLKSKTSGGQAKFAIRPFSSIKGIAVEKKAAESKPVVTAVQKPLPSQAEEDLFFLTEMAGVTRIKPRDAVRKSPGVNQTDLQAMPKAPETDESLVFLDALKGMKLDLNFAEAEAADEIPAPPRKVSRMRKLRRGNIRLDLEIDLHGLTRDEALDALAAFVAAAARRGQQAVLVITGKGLHSEGEPVLHGAVSLWLKNEGKEWVAEFVPAPSGMGGEGAIVVFLKGRTRQG